MRCVVQLCSVRVMACGGWAAGVLVARLPALPGGRSRRLAWLQALWGRTVDARVVLAGDHTIWDPGGGEAGAEMWTHLLLCRASGICAVFGRLRARFPLLAR